LVLRKISKFVATRCHILRLKCTKFNFRWGSVQYPAGEAYSTPPGPLTVFKGPTSKGRKGKGERRGRERERQKRGKERRREGICWTNVKLLPIRACYK